MVQMDDRYEGDYSVAFIATEEEDAAKQIWLISFADLLSVILCFFIMFYAMSTPTAPTWNAMREVFQENKKIAATGTPFLTTMPSGLHTPRYLYDVLHNKLKHQSQFASLRLELQQDQLRLTIPESVLFEAGKTDISLTGISWFFFVSDLLFPLSNRITIESVASSAKMPNIQGAAHKSDHTNINTALSAGELGLARAHVVAKELHASGYGYALSTAVSFHETPGHALLPLSRDVHATTTSVLRITIYGAEGTKLSSRR